MKSNYKKIGKYIEQVNIKNIKKLEINLLGVSVSKVFIPSIANTVGTDYSKYKVVKKNQFTYIPDTSRRGEKIGLALLDDLNEGLVSQAYTVFEVNDKNKLSPEYLMMWFKRPEFNRYARFISHGSVREIFSWEDMCNVSLPIPSIEKQKEIVKEYNVVQNRIDINNKLITKLEETAQAIYKHWFVDFDDNSILIGDILKPKKGKTITREQTTEGVYPVIAGGKTLSCYHNKYNTEKPVITVSASGANAGFINIHFENIWASDCSYIDKTIYKYIYFLYVSLKLNQNLLMSKQIGTGQPHIYPEHIMSLEIANYDLGKIINYEENVKPFFDTINLKTQETQKLEELKEILLSRLAGGLG